MPELTAGSKEEVMWQRKLPQRGMALIIALLLLLVLTVLAVAGMSSVMMQERMSGNVNLQTLSFEAASAAVADSLEFGLNKDNWVEDTCSRGSAGWTGGWTGFTALDVQDLPANTTVEYRRRIGCFESEDWGPEEEYGSVPMQLLVLNQGRVRRGESEVLSVREIEVRVENRGDQDCAIRIEGGLDSVDMPTSNRFEVDGGEGGCPISTGSGTGAADAINEDLRDKGRVGKYTPNPPGVHETDGTRPWNDAVELADLLNELKKRVYLYDKYNLDNYPPAIDPDGNTLTDPDTGEPLEMWNDDIYGPVSYSDLQYCAGTFYGGDTRVQGSGLGACELSISPQQSPSDIDDDHITYVAGNLLMGGNNVGSGIVIVEGAVCWHGGTSYEGMIIAMGGYFEMRGGGGSTNGSILFGNLSQKYPGTSFDDNNFNALSDDQLADWTYPFTLDGGDRIYVPVPYFENSGLKFSGGGQHSIKYTCDGPQGISAQIERIAMCLDRDIPDPCDPNAIGVRKAIASWREYIDQQRWPQ